VVLGLLVVAPLTEVLTGSTYYKLILAGVALLAGVASWLASLGDERRPVPGARWLFGLVALVAFQLVPLPPAILSVLSPGSYGLYNADSLVRSGAWHPLTINPVCTTWDLLELAGFALFYGAVHREFRHDEARRTLGWVLVGVGLGLTVEALYQESTPDPHKILGIVSLDFEDWGVFGLFSNRNHFAGYLLLVAPVGLGLAVEAWREVARAWRRRRVRGWLELGESSGGRGLVRSAVAMVLVVGVLATQSRGGVAAFVLSAAVLPFAFRSRLRALGVVVLLVVAGALWVDFGGLVQGFENRGVMGSRVDLWLDAARLVPEFPLFGTGLGAFGPAYLHYQTFWRGYAIVRAHNDYLQILLDTGFLGAIMALGLFLTTLPKVFRNASLSAFNAGLLGAILASMAHAFVDFDWQLPAIGLTFIAVVAIALHRGHVREEERR
jgi:O-antigen ligase